MGSVLTKSGRRKLFRFLITFILIVSAISYIFYGRHDHSGGLATAWTSSTGAEQSQIDAIGRSSQQQEQLGEGIDSPDDESSRVQEVATGFSEKDVSIEGPSTLQNQATIGKVTISFGEPNEIYDRAIRSHELHNRNMGYPQFVLRERLMSGLWSKHAYIFSVIVQELSKPEAERLKWIIWLDRDTVLMNPLIPLEALLPPPNFEHIHLLAANDRHGLNNGVFILKVNDWALKLFSVALAFHHFRPDVLLKYTEQSAMEEVLKEPWYNRSTAIVPQRWFNAFAPPNGKGKLQTNHARPGSLLIHFASDRDGLRAERMTRWMDIADQQTSQWSLPLNETFYPAELEEYWRRREKGENIADIIRDLENR